MVRGHTPIDHSRLQVSRTAFVGQTASGTHARGWTEPAGVQRSHRAGATPPEATSGTWLQSGRRASGAPGPPVADALRRVRATPPQATLVAAHRRLNIQGAFEVAGECRMLWTVPSLRGKTVVLADDVTTTGATLDACARVLRDAGAHQVHALTTAKVSPRPPRRLLPRPRPSDARRRSAANRAAGPDEDSCP